MTERWQVRAGAAPIARLEIPADLQRERRFEIAVAMTVQALAAAAAPTHGLRVFADGRLEWSRRIGTQHPAPYDGLDYRFVRSVPVGRPLRLEAHAECTQGRRLTLQIEADEI